VHFTGYKFVYSFISLFRNKKAFLVLIIGILFLSNLLGINLTTYVRAQSNPTYLFSDGFESGGFGVWAGTAGTAVVESAHPFDGVYDAKFSASASSSVCYKSVQSSATVFFGQWIELGSLPTAGNYLCLGSIQGASSNGVDAFVHNVNGQYYWGVVSVINGNYYWDQQSTPSNPPTGVYYFVETCRDVTGGQSKLWINGAPLVSVARPNSGNSTTVYSGLSYAGNAATIYVDDVVVSTSYVDFVNPSPTPTPTPNPGNLFSDGFESGSFSSWTAATGTSTVENAHPYDGTYDAKFTADAGDSVSYKTIQSSSTVYFGQYIELGNLPTSGNYLCLGSIKSDGPNGVDAFVHNVNGQYYWGIVSIVNGVYYWDQQSTASNPQVGVYYFVETYRVAGGQSGLWINGASLVNVARANSGSSNTIYSGLSWAGSSATIYVDDVVASVSYIQPILPGPSPTPSPTATPTPTPTSKPTATPSPTPTPTPTPIYKEATITKPIQASGIASDGTLYAGSFNTVYKSVDQGQNWQSLLTFSVSNVELDCVYVSSNNYVFASPNASATTSDLGIWRTINGGQSWTHVLALPAGCNIQSMAEDSNGYLFAGVYTMGNVMNARIYKSTNNGATWDTVYYNSAGRHIHGVTVDKSNNYVYATIGDHGISSWYGVVRSTSDGNNNTWSQILNGLTNTAQIDSIISISGARLFGSDDSVIGQIFRTTDDTSYTRVYNTGLLCYGFWFRQNSLNGYVYASFVSNEVSTTAGIYVSADTGVTWTVYKTFSVPTGGYMCSALASNFVSGIMYYSVRLSGSYQNGIKIYPSNGTGLAQLSLNTVDWLIKLSVVTALTALSATFVKRRLTLLHASKSAGKYGYRL
jgi:hypothetical protein